MIQSNSQLVRDGKSSTYELLVTLTTKTCTTWITENANGKISDMTRKLQLAASTCGITIPCIMSSQWQCQNDDPYKARFSTMLVGDAQTPTPSIVSCINKWFTDNGAVMSLPIGSVSYAVGLVPESGTGPQVNRATIGIVVVVVAAIVAVVVFRSRKSAKKKEPQKDFSEVYSITAVDNPLYSIAVVDNPLYADQEEGGDIYAGGAKGYEYIVYDSGTLEMKEDLGADDDDDRAFI